MVWQLDRLSALTRSLAFMLAIAAIVLLAAVNPADSTLEPQANSFEIESLERELVLDEELENALQNEEIVLDDSLLTDEESELLEFEE